MGKGDTTMRLKTYNAFLILIVVIAAIACGQKPKPTPQDDFAWLKANITVLNLPLSIDSTYLEAFIPKQKNPVPEEYLSQTGITEATEKMDGKLKFLVYPAGQVVNHDSTVVAFLFFITTNPEVPLDAEYKEVRIACFTSDGKLLSTKSVGLIQRLFRNEKSIYGTIHKFEGKSLKISTRTIINN